jgi:hypothetical protein
MAYQTKIKNSYKGTCKQEPRNVANELCASKWMKNNLFFNPFMSKT